jgi:hypothetical protein
LHIYAKNPQVQQAARRGDSKTFQITINVSSGLSWKIGREWRRRSFQDLPDVLIQFRNPKTKAAAKASAFALVEYLKKKLEEGTARRVRVEDITVGAWIEKFTAMETSPRTGANASKNRPYSPDTVGTYRNYYNAHIKGDPFTNLKMAEVEEEALEVIRNVPGKGRPPTAKPDDSLSK